MPTLRNSSSLPMPDTCNNCGELKAPPHRITSLARTTFFLPNGSVYSTPTTVLPSVINLVASALHCTVRFLRCFTGCRYARAALNRRPRLTFRSNAAKPSCLKPFTSDVSGWPASCTALKNAPNRGFLTAPRSICSGPLLPRNSSLGFAAMQDSIFLKYGKQCA